MKEGSRNKDMLSWGLEWACFNRGPDLGSWRDALFLGRLDKEMYKEICKISCKWVSLSIGSPLGNLEGIRLPGLFERKRKCIWVPFLDPEDIKILSLGPPGTFVNGQGCPKLISDYGARRVHL